MTEQWYKTAFGAAYSELYAHRDREDARRAVDFLLGQPDLRPAEGGRVLDLCCGAGRHSLEILARTRAQVVGLDLSSALLAQAAEAARASRCPLALSRGDMRKLPFADASFPLVINLFTSFGYFAEERENDAVLAEIARVLTPGSGRLALDHVNPSWLRANLRPETARVTESGARVRERRVIDEAHRRIEKWTEIERNGGKRVFLESVRFYEPEEMQAKGARTGLRPLRTYGGFDASPLTRRSPRAVYVFAAGDRAPR